MQRSQIPLMLIAGLAGGVAIGAEFMRPAYLAADDTIGPMPTPAAIAPDIAEAPRRPDVLYIPHMLSGERGGVRWTLAQIPTYAPAPTAPPVKATRPKATTVARRPTQVLLGHKPATPVHAIAHKPAQRQIAHAKLQHKQLELAAVATPPNTVPESKHLTIKQKLGKLWIGLKSKFKHKGPTA